MRPAATVGLALLVLAPPIARAGDPAKDPPRDVSALIEPLLKKHGIPGMAAAVVEGDRLVAVGAVGVRAAGSDARVGPDDLWHLGSCTKAMTATLCGMLVEEGKLSWTTTVGGTFPDIKAIDPKWKGVTLEQLLTNRSGAPAELHRDGLWGRLWAHRGTPVEARRMLVEGVVAIPPLFEPGSAYTYSNAGFAIAGHMAETVLKKPWEALLRERLFRPLGIESAGYGAPGSRERVDQPRGHRDANAPVPPGPGSDNPVAIGPAGIVHMSIADWGKFVGLHLEGDRGNAPLLKKETFGRLHAALPEAKKGYAMGWGVDERDWADGRVLTHAGSNTMWFCVTWIAPKKGFAVLVCCNLGGDAAAKGCDEAAWALIRDALARR